MTAGCWCQAAGGGDELQQLGPDPRHAAEPGHPAGGGGHRHDGYPGQPPAVCRIQDTGGVILCAAGPPGGQEERQTHEEYNH